MKNLQRVGALFLIIAVTFFVYWPAQRNGFVWDDHALILRDPLIRSWRLIPEGFRHFLFLDATPSNFYRPLQRLTFTADYALWDFLPRGYHLTSIYAHAAAAVALYFLAEKMIVPAGRKRWACGVALLWAIHPLHTSAVTYVAGRADPLAAFFGFAALVLGLMSLEAGKRARLATIGAAACFLAAMLSKESGVFALIAWLLMLAWRRVPREIWVKWAAVVLVVLAIYGGLRFTAQKVPPPPSKTPPLAERPILAARAFAEYAGLFFAPTDLRMERDVTIRSDTDPEEATWRRWQALVGAMLVASAIGWWLWARHRTPSAALALLAAFAAYLPISNLLPLNATVAEHWLYVPSAFLLIAAAISLREIGIARPRLIGAGSFVVAVWAVALGMRTWQRQADWKDQRTFLTRTIEAGSDSARMHVNLGQLESSEGRDDLALEEFKVALRREPDLSFALLGMAAVNVRLGDYTTARHYLAKAETHPAIAAECRQLRASLEHRETKADTTDGLREAAELAPHSWPARRRYIVALDQQGRRDEALLELKTLLEREPFRGESWRMLGDLLANLHQPQLAIEAFTEASRRDVHDGESLARSALIRRLNPTQP